MKKTRNEFIEECKQIINSTTSIDDINEALNLKFGEIIEQKGCIYIKDNVWTVAIHEARLKKLLKTEGFNEWGTASNELKRRGILLGTEEKKKNGKITHRTRRCVNGVWCNVFKFEMPSEQIFEGTEERETEQQPTLSQSEMKTDIENWNDDEAMRDFFAEGDENA